MDMNMIIRFLTNIIKINALIILLVFNIFGLSSSSAWADSSQVMNKHPGSSTVDFGDVRYEIPNVYLPGVTPLQPRGYASFTLQILLPDFEPGASDMSAVKAVGWHRQLTVLAEYGEQFIKREDLIASQLAGAHVDKTSFTIANNGCKLYTGNFIGGEEFYVCDSSRGIFAFGCHSIQEVPSPDCSVLENLDSKSTIIYHYSRDFVDKAVAIDQNIRNLIESFRINRAK